MIPQVNTKIKEDTPALIEGEVIIKSDKNTITEFKIEGDLDHINSDHDQFMDDTFINEVGQNGKQYIRHFIVNLMVFNPNISKDDDAQVEENKKVNYHVEKNIDDFEKNEFYFRPKG